MKFTDNIDESRMDSMMAHYRNEILRMQRARPTYIKLYDKAGEPVEPIPEELSEIVIAEPAAAIEAQKEEEEKIQEAEEEQEEKEEELPKAEHENAVIKAFGDKKYERCGFGKGLGFYGKFKPYEKDYKSPLFFLQSSNLGASAFMRFSSDIDKNCPDTTRCARGLALRLHDDQNQCDLLFNSIPVGAASNFSEGEEFFKSKNRCTKTGLWDYSRLWAFAVKNPASLNFLFYLFSDLGTPSSLRTIEYYTYPLIRVEGDDVCAIKLRLIPSQREKPFSMYMAQELAGSDSDYLLRDIFRAVKENRVYFELGAQVIPQKLWNQQESDIFNPTIMWNSAEIPIVPLGVVTVEASVKNHLEDTEKTCFRIDNLCSGLYLPDREIFREGAKTMGELSKLRVGVPYSFDESKFSAAEIGDYKKDGVALLKERMTDMGERESRRLLENIAESLKTLDGMTLEKVLLLITDLNFSFGRALMNLLEA